MKLTDIDVKEAKDAPYQDEQPEEKLWNADRHTHSLAQIILSNVNGICKKRGISLQGNTYDALLTKQLDKVERMLRANIDNIQSSDNAFSGIGSRISEDPNDKVGFRQFVTDFDGQLDSTINDYWTQAEIEYAEDGSSLSPEFEQALERVVSSYCKQCNV